MKIIFDKTTDFNLFFNMLSANKVYSEISEKIEDFNPPETIIDFLVMKVAKIVVDNKFYSTTLKDEKPFLGLAMFSLGMDITKLTYNEMKAINMKINSDDYFYVNRIALCDFLMKENIDI